MLFENMDQHIIKILKTFFGLKIVLAHLRL